MIKYVAFFIVELSFSVMCLDPRGAPTKALLTVPKWRGDFLEAHFYHTLALRLQLSQFESYNRRFAGPWCRCGGSASVPTILHISDARLFPVRRNHFHGIPDYLAPIVCYPDSLTSGSTVHCSCNILLSKFERTTLFHQKKKTSRFPPLNFHFTETNFNYEIFQQQQAINRSVLTIKPNKH